MTKRESSAKKRGADRDMPLEAYKKERQKIALQLGYGYEVVDQIKAAKSEVQVDRILRSARNMK